MDKQSKLEYQQRVEKYLNSNQVYDLFEDLLKTIVVKQPSDPIAYLIELLSQNSYKKIFIVGPPGFRIRQIALQVADHYKLTTVSIGDLLRKEVSKKLPLGEQIEKDIKKLNYVKDDIVIQIVNREIQNLLKQKKGFIIEGYPKTRVQALALQRSGVLPDAFIILNLSPQKLYLSCEEKLRIVQRTFQKLSQTQRKTLISNYSLEYNLNIKHVQDTFKNNFFSMDATNSKQQLVQQIARLLRFKIKSKRQNRIPNILICGPPGSGKTSLANVISKKYGIVYISTQQLLSDQIHKKTEVGRLALSIIRNGQLIPDDIMNGLIHNRISQIDCHLHGYILQGFPKTQIQINSLADLKIEPTHVIVLECDNDISIQRLGNRRIDPVTGIVYQKMHKIQDQEIQRRVLKQPNDQKQIVEKRIKRWKQILKILEKKYEKIIFKVNSNSNFNQALQNISFHLQNSGN